MFMLIVQYKLTALYIHIAQAEKDIYPMLYREFS